MSSLKDLREIGAFIPDELVKKEITFTLTHDAEEKTAIIHVRRLSIGIHESIFLGGEPDQISRTAKLLSEAIRLGDKGEEVLSYVDAYQLDPKLANAMAAAIGEVNGGDRKN